MSERSLASAQQVQFDLQKILGIEIKPQYGEKLNKDVAIDVKSKSYGRYQCDTKLNEVNLSISAFIPNGIVEEASIKMGTPEHIYVLYEGRLGMHKSAVKNFLKKFSKSSEKQNIKMKDIPAIFRPFLDAAYTASCETSQSI